MLVGFEALAQDFSHDFYSVTAGLIGTVMVHESGHALAAKAVGWKVETFRPFPTKMIFTQEDGTKTEQWVLGMVKSDPGADLGGPNFARNQAWISAMGSGAAAMAVVLLAPLLPELNGFGASALNDMLVFSTFEWPAYALVDTIAGLNVSWLKANKFGDWNQVAAASGVNVHWYFLAGLAESLILNQYRLHFRREAIRRGAISSAATADVGVTVSF